MKSAAFEYRAPPTVEAAIAALAESADSRVLAGGQSLGPMMNLRLATPTLLVDLRRLDGLRGVADEGERHVIGAMVTHSEIEDGAHSFADAGMLAFIAHRIAYRAVRNRGTIGGSIAHADPAADWPTALLALGAGVAIEGPAGRRELALDAFLTGAFSTALEPGEILTALTVPKLGGAARWGYYKICRKVGEFPEAIGAVVLDKPRGFARVVMGALDGPPAVLGELAARLAAEGAVDPEAIAHAVAGAAPGLDEIDRRLHAVAVKRAIAEATRP
jgi:aerobic carbon-monoxide dehydrogenase medium subunit